MNEPDDDISWIKPGRTNESAGPSTIACSGNGPPPHDPVPRPQGGARTAPRWVVPFLRALERTGQVEAAARDAGIDKSTAYERRRRHPDFAADWEEALARRSGRVDEEVKERAGFWQRVRGKVTAKMLGIGRKAEPAPVGAPGSPPPHPRFHAEREELMATTALGGQVKRVGAGRFGKAAEARFFEELAATSNLRRACAAAGVSTSAIHARRMKRPDFDAKCQAVLETGRAAIDMHLVETTRKAFDPGQLDIGEVQPKVSVAEAIRIVQLHGKTSERKAIEAAEPSEAEGEAARERIFRKLEKLQQRFRAEELAAGWSLDESYDTMVPPGWVKGPDYKPKPPDPPGFWEQIAAGE